jgi:hypothetical protein
MKLTFLHILILLSSLSFAQTKVSLEKKRLKIGEQTELKYEISFSDKEGQLSFIPYKGSIPCLVEIKNSSIQSNKLVNIEILGDFKDTLFKKDNKLTWIGTYKICSWDTGNFILPPTTISSKDSIYQFEQLKFSVSSPKLLEGKEIYDIKEQYVELPNDYFSWFKSYWYWFVILFILGIIVFLYYKKKNKKEIIPEKELSLKEKSLLAVNALEQAKLWEKDQLKEHYIELSFILRSYLSARYDLNLLEKTSFETSLLLVKKELDKSNIDKIKLLLDYSDMVKFAKSKPDEFEVFKNLAQAKQLIVETSPLQIEHV